MLNIRTSLLAKSWMINNIMKYLIFAVALLVASNADGNCPVYNCDTIPTATPPNCIAASATAVNVNTCPSGSFCNYAAAGYPAKAILTNQACTTNPTPPNPPTPV